MDMMDYLRQYGSEVRGRYNEFKKDPINTFGKTLATALQQGMPTQENPLGMFGAGAITKMHGLPNVFKSNRHSGGMEGWKYDVPKSALPDGVKASKDNLVISLHDGTKMYKLDDGSFTDTTGKITFKDLPSLFDHIKNPPPQVVRSNRPENLQYKDPFGDTTK
jgi:hypothetical protein